MTLENFREEFPVLNSGIYADTAANGLLGKTVLEWRRNHDRSFLEGGAAMKLDAGAIFRETRKRLAAGFNTVPEQVGLVQNFSVGFNFILEALDNDLRVLLLEDEYPSVSWPVQSRRFPFKTLSLSPQLESTILTEVGKGKTDVLAVSMVQYLNGLLLAPDFFKNLKKTFPEVLVLVDGTQYCGAFELDFTDSGIDILGCSGYKWLLAGYGNGFFLFKPGVFEKLAFKSTGFNAARGEVTAQHRFAPVHHLEPGHLDQLSFGTLNRSLQILEEVGMDTIASQNRELSRLAKTGLEELGLLDTNSVRRPQHSTIFNIPFSRERWEVLAEAGVSCSQRGGGIRLSFHAYNTADEVLNILALLKNNR